MEASTVERRQLARAKQFPSLKREIPIHSIPTSFVAETPEVRDYIELLSAGRSTIAYEFVQNQLDYQDWSKGTPEIWIVTTSGERISYPEFISSRFSIAEKKFGNVARLEFVNDILNGKGLKPENIVHTKHGGGRGTLGEHGRGGKAAGAALVAGGHARSIEYESHDEKGTWRGEAVMAVDNEMFPDQTDPSYTLGYQRTEAAGEVNKTTIAINDPSAAFIESIYNLKHFFLPSNPEYNEYRLNHIEHPTDSTLFAVRFGDHIQAKDKVGVIDSSTAEALYGVNPEEVRNEPARIEILPWDITRIKESNSELTDHVFVDGLFVDAGYHYYANRWAFWGMNEGKYGYQAKRTNNSSYMHGDVKNAIAVTLGKCTNPQVFKNIFNVAEKQNSQKCDEGSVPDIFLETIKKHPEAGNAMKTAWTEYCTERNLEAEKVYITSDKSSLQKAEARGIQSVLLDAPSMVTALHELGIGKQLEKSVDLPADPKQTGEKSKIFMDRWEFGNKEESMARGALYLLDRAEFDNAEVYIEGSGVITLKIPIGMTRDRDWVKNRAKFLSSSMDVIWATYGAVGTRTTVIDNGEAMAYELIETPEQKYWDTKYIYLTPQEREIKSRGELYTTLTFTPDGGGDLEGYKKFVRQLHDAFVDVTSDGCHVDGERLKNKVNNERNAVHREVSMLRSELATLEETIRVKKADLERGKIDELKHLDEQIADKQRLLGMVAEDAQEISPTREGLSPKQRTDYKPPQELKRTHTTLYSPDAHPHASNAHGKAPNDWDAPSPQMEEESRVRTTVEARQLVETHMEAIERPDIQMLRPLDLPPEIRDTLICHRSGLFSSEAVFEDVHLPNERTIAKPGIVINKELVAGKHDLPLFPNCRVVGIHHSDPKVLEHIRVQYAANHNTYTFSSDIPIPQGVEFYVEYDENHTVKTPPSSKEQQKLTRNELFDPRWRQLIDTVVQHEPPLTSKEKLDVALTAWLHAFTYDKDARVDKLYLNLSPEERYAEVVNKAIGNCGYVAEGFVTLCRALDLPSVELIGYLGKRGRFFPGPQNHALASVYLEEEKEWIVVEPQALYLSKKFTRGKIGEEFTKIIEHIPEGKNIFPFTEQSEAKIGIDAIVDQLRKSGLKLDDDTIRMLVRLKHIQEDEDELFAWDMEMERVPGRRRDGSSKSIGELDEIITEGAIRRKPQSKAGNQEDGPTVEEARLRKKKALRKLGIYTAIGLLGLGGVELANLAIQTLHAAQPIVTATPTTMQTLVPTIEAGTQHIQSALPSLEFHIPQILDSLKIDAETAKIIIASVLSGAATHVRDAVKYGKIIKSLRSKIDDSEAKTK